MFFPSLYSGISGLARSVNHVCRLASFKVARAGNLNVEGLGDTGQQRWKSARRVVYWMVTYGTGGILSLRRAKIRENIFSSSDTTPSLNALAIISFALHVSACVTFDVFQSDAIHAKGAPTEAEGIAIPFLTFDWERMSSS